MSIVASVIGIVTLLLKRWTKKKFSPNANYLISMVFLIALICPISIPSRVSVYNYVDIENMKYNNVEGSSVVKRWNQLKKNNDRTDADEIFENNNKLIFKNYLELAFALAWLIGLITKLVETLIFYITIMIRVGKGKVEDERILAILENCKERLKIKRNIKLIRQDKIEMPSTIGIFNVKILVTDSFLELDDIAIHNVIIHELSHYKRKDNIVNFMMVILKAVYWFNPIMKIMFKTIRSEMEFAADEIAINHMGLEGQRSYCKVMLMISTMDSLEAEPILLGVSATAKTIEKRIEMISRKEMFEKNSKMIATATFFIMMLMCLVFYPTSYARFKIPKLYLELENGDKIEVVRIDEENDFGMNEIRLKQDSEVSLVVKNGKSNEYIFYDKVDLNTMQMSEKVANIASGKIAYFESGEFVYNFVLTYGKNQMANYAVKIIVE